MKEYVIYIMSNYSKTLYVGVTSNLEKRINEHKMKQGDGFTQKYNITNLVYFETFQFVQEAIEREKQIKGWLRKKKIDLIESMNPEWKDFANEF